MIKAIETRYKGYRFRSRLEARWAVFFDALGMPWEYEKEGFDLPGVGPYLPDFYITKNGRSGYQEQCSLWAEVKPDNPTSQERDRCVALVRETQTACLLLVGLPDYCEYEIIDMEYSGLVLLHSSKNRIWGGPTSEDIQYHLRESAEYVTAISAARAARFEHGERGQ